MSRRGTGLRSSDANPIIIGATVMVPSVSVTNQCRHIVVADEAEG